MKFLKVALLASTIFITACDRVPPGMVGIMVDSYGSSKGVENEVLDVGRYWVGFGKTLYTFPVFLQNYVFTASPHEGGPLDESISFQTSDGLVVKSNIGVQYQLRKEKVPYIFQKYRVGVEEITHLFLRNVIRDQFVLIASKYTVEDLYGEKKSEFMQKVNAAVKNAVISDGIEVNSIYVVGNFELPQRIVDAINAKIGAIQESAKHWSEVETAKADAQKIVETAKGEATKKQIEGEAIAKYNATVTASITPTLIQYITANKWNGILPTVTSGGIPLINLEGQK